MPISPNTSAKLRIMRRVKALGVLLLPFVAFAAVVFLSSILQSRIDQKNNSVQPTASSDYSVTLDDSPAIDAKTATGTTTYIVTGRY